MRRTGRRSRMLALSESVSDLQPGVADRRVVGGSCCRCGCCVGGYN